MTPNRHDVSALRALRDDIAAEIAAAFADVPHDPAHPWAIQDAVADLLGDPPADR